MRRAHFPVTDSTSTQAKHLYAQSPGEPMLVTAGAQTAGRGRVGRSWSSPAGGAWFTLAWPTAMTPAIAAAVPLVAGLAVRDEVASLVNACQRVCIKWPNDVLLDECKLAGILCEQHMQPGVAQRVLLVGVGINANLAPEAIGDDLRQPATSLRVALGGEVDLDGLIDACAERIATNLRDLERGGLTAATVSRLNDVLAWRDQPVSLLRGGTRMEGVLRGIDETGRAIIGDTAYEAGEVMSLMESSSPQAGSRTLGSDAGR